MLPVIMAATVSSNEVSSQKDLYMQKEDKINIGGELVKAAERGSPKDLSFIKEMVESGVSVDAEEYNRTLFYASKNYMTPLQVAATNNHLDCLEYLISRGADVNAKDRFDVTALHMASEKGNLECVTALLDAYADPSPPTKYSKPGCYVAVPHIGGTTPLHLAAANNHPAVIKELILYGADYNAVDARGRTPLYIAACLGFSECVLVQLRNAIGRDILSLPSTESGDTPLHFAVARGMAPCIEALLGCGSDPNYLNFQGDSPLHTAVKPTWDNEKLSLDILRLLVLKGYNADVNVQNGSGMTPLSVIMYSHPGLSRHRSSMSMFLIAYGADLISKYRGKTMLERELWCPSDDRGVLQYMVRALPELRLVSSMMKTGQQCEEIHRDAQARLRERNPDYQLLIQQRQAWYSSFVCQPRSLQHFCRYAIRKSLVRVRDVVSLPIPESMHSFLLLERD